MRKKDGGIMKYYKWRSGPFGFEMFGTYFDLLCDKWADPKDRLRIEMEHTIELTRRSSGFLAFPSGRCKVCGATLSIAEAESSLVVPMCFRCRFGSKSEEK